MCNLSILLQCLLSIMVFLSFSRVYLTTATPVIPQVSRLSAQRTLAYLMQLTVSTIVLTKKNGYDTYGQLDCWLLDKVLL